MKPYLKDLFDSKAKVIYITRFRFGNVKWSKTSTVNKFTYTFSPDDTINYFFKVPVIIKSNGLPWKIGNAYLVNQLDTPKLSEMKTLSSRAIHLKYYLQYLEHHDYHYLDLPDQYQQRVPRKFRSFLQGLIEEHGYSSEYINTILSSVVHFYKFIYIQALLPSEALENMPFTEREVPIHNYNHVGLYRKINVITNDLKVKSSRQPMPSIGRLRDGGSLRPLSIEEQTIILNSFDEDLASIELELMITVALLTGARQQSVCTLSIECIFKALNYLERYPDSNHSVINTGYRYKTDSKGGRLNRLIFPHNLLYRLSNYIDCERAENRRNNTNSFYGKTNNNYVFLTRTGNPYLTAERELRDRNNPKPIWNTDAPVLVPKNGQALRNELRRFICKIQQFEPTFNNFSYHDLRATYGMNIVRNLRNQGYPDSKIFDHVRQRLNHKSLSTTEAYLKFDSESKEFMEVQNAFGATHDKDFEIE